MTRPVLTFALIAALALAAPPAQALSIVAAREHDQRRACAAVADVLAAIRERDPEGKTLSTIFTTDALGTVEYEERQRFFDAMTSSEGRADERPARIERLYRLTDDKFSPLYLVRIERMAWREFRYEEDMDGNGEHVRDPRFNVEGSYWLIGFSSDEIQQMREGFEFFALAKEGREVRCG